MAVERAEASPGQLLGVEEQLRRFESLTDIGLAYLDPDDLLVELLDRVRDLLQVDTATVLMLEESGSHLVATVARGIEDEVGQGVRIPFGQGFAGRIAKDKRPLTIESIGHGDLLSPALRNEGIRSLLGVPLIGHGVVIGVLHVGTLEQRAFVDEDINLLQTVGDRMALAIQASSMVAERSAVTALQRSLLPTQLPLVPGLSAAARYVPAAKRSIGGDWYDLFTLPNGQVCVVIGDVVGHGLRAAVVMGRLRSALRAYAFDGASPGDVLARLHRKLQHFEPGEMATVLLATFDPSLEHVEISSAGHLPALLAAPGAASAQVDISPDPPLGVAPDVTRRTATIKVPSGGVMCLYTDGLVERRGVPLDDCLARLCAAVVADEPEAICASAMSALIGNELPTDDIAMIAVRRDAPGTHNAVVVPADPSSLAQIRFAMRRWLIGAGVPAEDVNDLLVAVGEAAANSVEHAYGALRGTIEVRLDLDSNEAVAMVRDKGKWRPPRGDNRGRGMLLMERCSDDVQIASSASGTEVTIRRRLSASNQP